MKNETLAQRLGTTAQLSPLLIKAQRLGLCVPQDFERLAVRRGCLYYDDTSIVQESFDRPISRLDFSNAELAISLLCKSLPTSLLRQRMAAAMLSAPDVEPHNLIALARNEDCEQMVKHIAKCGAEVEPSCSFWSVLLSALDDCGFPETDAPHPTRFIEMTGITRGKIGIQKHWIRPVPSLALAP